MNPHIHKIIIFALITFFIVSWTSFLHHSGFWSFNQSQTGNPDLFANNSILNSTLGFQEIFALALPGRSDRVLPLLDAANASNISITVLDAVRDKQIPKESWPKTWGEEHKPGELGCLVSHVRTWEKIIAEGISSAMIMESDADWDLRIADIMVGVGEGVAWAIDWPFRSSATTAHSFPENAPLQSSSPYGNNWDIIWMGHCGAQNHGNGRIYEINDTSVPPENYEYTFASGPHDEEHRPGTRTVFQIGGTVCSTAYAISYQGAVKLVEYFKQTNTNVDLALSNFCNSKVDMACVAVWPQVVTAASTKSNIEHPDGETAGAGFREAASPGPALQYSARVNSELVLQGLGRESWIPQWNSTWAMKHGNWSLVSFPEAKKIAEAEEVQRLNGTIGR